MAMAMLAVALSGCERSLSVLEIDSRTAVGNFRPLPGGRAGSVRCSIETQGGLLRFDSHSVRAAAAPYCPRLRGLWWHAFTLPPSDSVVADFEGCRLTGLSEIQDRAGVSVTVSDRCAAGDQFGFARVTVAGHQAVVVGDRSSVDKNIQYLEENPE
jgi:hypothetical protein